MNADDVPQAVAEGAAKDLAPLMDRQVYRLFGDVKEAQDGKGKLLQETMGRLSRQEDPSFDK
jgi:hypothetical protein